MQPEPDPDTNAAMACQVAHAVAQRRSCRDFTAQPVDEATLREVIALALRAPSGGNLQPWWLDVLTGATLETLKARAAARLAALGGELPPDGPYRIYPAPLGEPYRTRRFELGEAMYARLGIPRTDRAARLAWFARNYAAFGAPVLVVCTVDASMGAPQWSDLGMMLQTLMLLAQARGLATCAQEAWSTMNGEIMPLIGRRPHERGDAAHDRFVFCAVALGHANPAHPVNALRSPRAAFDEVVRLHR